MDEAVGVLDAVRGLAPPLHRGLQPVEEFGVLGILESELSTAVPQIALISSRSTGLPP